MSNSSHCKKLAALSENEYDKYHNFEETTPQLSKRIELYWNTLDMAFPGVSVAWSAVFISYFIKISGGGENFKYSSRHSTFVNWSIRNSIKNNGFYHGRKISEYAPKIGDIVHNNRNGNSFDFDFAKQHDAYESHCAIVVEEGVDGNGRYIRTIGGNESDSVGQRIIRLNTTGLIQQPKADKTRFICVIQNML